MSARLVRVGVLEAHVDDLGPALHLGPADLRRLLERFASDEPA